MVELKLMQTSDDGGRTASPLPPPDPQALAHSARLQQRIRRDMDAAGGAVTFARYMHLALYEPGLGYYSAGLRKFGREGDFITAPEISPLFSRCVARQCAQALTAGVADILEFGAGSGAMARDVLLELEALGALPEHYFIIEVSAELRQRQHETLSRALPHLLGRIQWLERLPPPGLAAVVIANEVLDAFPVHRFFMDDRGRPGELCVAWEQDRFAWRRGPLSGEHLQAALQEIDEAVGLFGFAPGYTSEISLAVEGWLASLAQTLERGLVLLIDYGFPRREYYHPQRGDGTLMCHYRHFAHSDPLCLTGLQDITAPVAFTAVAESGHRAGFAVAGYTNQANFLLAAGLHEMLPAVAHDQAAGYVDCAQQVKKLTLPHEMGELFKVIALTRGLDMPLLGFSLRDDRARL